MHIITVSMFKRGINEEFLEAIEQTGFSLHKNAPKAKENDIVNVELSYTPIDSINNSVEDSINIIRMEHPSILSVEFS